LLPSAARCNVIFSNGSKYAFYAFRSQNITSGKTRRLLHVYINALVQRTDPSLFFKERHQLLKNLTEMDLFIYMHVMDEVIIIKYYSFCITARADIRAQAITF